MQMMLRAMALVLPMTSAMLMPPSTCVTSRSSCPTMGVKDAVKSLGLNVVGRFRAEKKTIVENKPRIEVGSAVPMVSAASLRTRA